MALKELVQKLANEKNHPCVSISLNTHRTHPENQQDEIVLKNLLKDAENRIIKEFGKRPAAEVLEKLEKISEKVDHQQNLESLHIFLSKDTEEIVKSTWKSRENTVEIDSKFSVRPLIKALGRSQEYYILLLTQSGTRLFEALNDSITKEVEEEGFPFPENPFYITDTDVRSDAKQVDNKIKEYFNRIDKSTVEMHKSTGLDIIVIATEDNYSKLLEVADRPQIYIGHDHKNYVESEEHHIVEQAYEIIKEKQKAARALAIQEIKESAAQGKVITDLQEIYQAAIDGRAETLIVHHDFEQAVKMIDDRTFDYAEDAKEAGVVDDIVSTIAWEVLSKNGKVHFTQQKELSELGKIALKTRY